MTLQLLPYPRFVKEIGGFFELPLNGRIVLDVPRPAGCFFTAQRLQRACLALETDLSITGSHTLAATVRIILNAAFKQPESYKLTITGAGIVVEGKDLAGIFYGVMTLMQLLQTQGRTLPQVVIEDYPDFPARGVMLDISRDKVPTMATFYTLIDLLASWKINQLQLYIEHTFAYSKHETVWKNASPMTAEEILALDAYCRERFIELVPNQNSFGHMERWLKHPEYAHLGETETGMPTPWGTIYEYPFSLAPAVPETLLLVEELFDELLPNFTSKMFNIGADETFDLGMGRSADLVNAKGKGQVYLDYLLELYKRVKVRGHTMQFWGDIINQYPELVPHLPKDAVALEWGYEADHDFPGKSKLFAEAGIPFYVCPGTSSWVTLGGRTDNCLENIRNAVENGLKNGAVGVLNTDWGDRGHWQPLVISYLGFAYGAGLSWCYAANVEMDVPAILDAFVFHDEAGQLGKLAYDLGNAYQKPGVLLHNSSLLWRVYQDPLTEVTDQHPSTLIPALQDTIAYIETVMEGLTKAHLHHHQAETIQREFSWAARMMQHGAKRGLLMLEVGDEKALLSEFDALAEEFQQVWLARHRQGGLADSLARLHKARTLYTD